MSGLLIGYARVSTEEQDLTAQRDGLAHLGVEPSRIYVDHGLTGTNRDRPGLVTESSNHWRLHFDPGFQLRTSRWPGDRCPHVLTGAARAALQARAPRRWDDVDLA